MRSLIPAANNDRHSLNSNPRWCWELDLFLYEPTALKAFRQVISGRRVHVWRGRMGSPHGGFNGIRTRLPSARIQLKGRTNAVTTIGSQSDVHSTCRPSSPSTTTEGRLRLVEEDRQHFQVSSHVERAIARSASLQAEWRTTVEVSGYRDEHLGSAMLAHQFTHGQHLPVLSFSDKISRPAGCGLVDSRAESFLLCHSSVVESKSA